MVIIALSRPVRPVRGGGREGRGIFEDPCEKSGTDGERKSKVESEEMKYTGVCG